MKKNVLNVLLLFFSFNFYLLQHISPQTFDAGVYGRDNGWPSILIIWILVATQALALYQAFLVKKGFRLDWISLAYIIQIYILRECDVHRYGKTFPNGHTFTASNFFRKTDAPMMLKIVVAICFILMFAALIRLAIRYVKPIALNFFKRTPWAVSMSLWFFFLLVSQIQDKSPLNQYHIKFINHLEEWGEMTAALYALLAVITFSFLRVPEEEACSIES